MPEAVIVSTARSPIGRAMKGSLVGMRPDDLAVQMVRAALDKVPALNPHQIDDLMMGCGLPGGESGFNIARVVAVALGYDFLPGTTVNRYCSSSLQTTRMAFHAIKAGEGDAFISAGVETVSRFAKGNSDSWPDTKNPLFDGAQERSAAAAAGADEWHDPRTDQKLPDIYIAMGQTAENVAIMTGISREEQDRWGVRSQNRAEEAIKNGFFEREITPVTLPDGTTVSTDDGPRPGTTYEKVSELKPAFRPNGTVTAGNACPLNDGAAAVVITSDTKAKELGLTPLARIVSTGVSGLSPEIMGLGPIEASKKALERAGMAITDIDLVTQIPLLGVYGHPKYFLDMGWEDIMLAVEYDGEQHRLSRDQFVKDVERLEYIRRAGWTHIRVLADHKGPDVVRRVRQAWDTLTSRR